MLWLAWPSLHTSGFSLKRSRVHASQLRTVPGVHQGCQPDSVLVCTLQTSHFTPTQAGQIFEDIRPKLAVIHHATVNDASREALISVVRAEYPTGAIA